MAQQGDPHFTLPSILILAALGFSAWNARPLQSARPEVPEDHRHQRPVEGRIPARLWQDPFQAAERHAAELEAAASGVAAAAATAPGGRSAPQLADDVARALATTPGETDPELTVLVVPLTPGPYVELEERRRRRRYAILSALGAFGFGPRSAETLGLYRLGPPTDPAAATPGADAAPAADASSPFPATDVLYEWFDFEAAQGDAAGARSVLLLWLDEVWLAEAPFERLVSLVKAVHGARNGTPIDERRARWVVLGPSGSGTLREMIRSSERARDLADLPYVAAFHVLSPVATVDDRDFDAASGQDSCTATANGADPSRLLGGAFTEECAAPGETPGRPCMRFLRTIRSDKVLIEKVAEELVERRGVRAGDTVIVLSEWDTYFGRSLPRALEDALSERDIVVRRYAYERGIDGIAHGEPSPQLSVPAGDKKDGEAAPSQAKLIRRPFGTGQFDYLRRLAQVVRQQHEERKLSSGRGIRAVAVLGSDVYDKLLILGALRDQLPGAIWITTDLDANFLHPAEFAWARNLIVASSYPLEAPSELGATTPPFRDSYQTSAYLATAMAIDPVFRAGASRPQEHWATRYWQGAAWKAAEPFPDQEAVYEAIPPLLFEIGRSGAVRLRDADLDGRCAQESPKPMTCAGDRQILPYLLGGGLLIAIALFALHQHRPRSGRSFVLGFGLLALAIGIAAIAWWKAPGGEPLLLQAGVSMWPTIFLRFLTIGVTLVFVWSTLERTDESWQELHHEYLGGTRPTRDRGLTLREILARPKSWGRPAAWAIGSGILLLASAVVMGVMRRVDQPVATVVLIQFLVFLAIALTWWAFIYGRLGFDVRVRSINAWMMQDPGAAAEPGGRDDRALQIWESYRAYGKREHRVLRAASGALVYLAFGSIVFALFGGDGVPARGTAARALNGLSLAVGVPLMLFLLFLTVDAIRLCVAWIGKLRELEFSWTGPAIVALAKRCGLPEAHAGYWLQIQLIGRSTEVVGRLLYYPLIVILLMLLARSSYFDDFGFPAALAIVVGINFAIALAAAAILNAAARRAREEILDRLRSEGMALAEEQLPEVPVATAGEIDALIEKLSALRLGAFQRLWDQPLARAAAVLLAGLGLTYTEYAPFLH